MRNTLIQTFLILSLFVGMFSMASAQSFGEAGIILSLTPKSPGPNETVVAKVESFTTDLDLATISWLVNGKLVKREMGGREYQLTTSNLGVSTIVNVVIKTSNLGIFEKSITITPVDADLIWQANSYTPPFYKGKSLSSPETSISVVAIPNFVLKSGKKLSPSELVFTWKRSGIVVGDSSGLGKNLFIVSAPRLTEDTVLVEVDIRSPAYSLSAYRRIGLNAVNPEIIFYENHPLLGVLLNKNTPKNFSLDKDEFAIMAYPYFFQGRDSSAQELVYRWRINGVEVKSTGEKNELTVRKPAGGVGSSVVSLAIESLKTVFERAEESILINLGAKQQL